MTEPLDLDNAEAWCRTMNCGFGELACKELRAERAAHARLKILARAVLEKATTGMWSGPMNPEDELRAALAAGEGK